MKCKFCKEEIELRHAIIGGYKCPNCNRFNPKERATICCLEKKGEGDNKCKPALKFDLGNGSK